MRLEFVPVVTGGTLSLERSGDILTINGEAFDFGPLPAGGLLPRASIACAWIAGDVTRTGAGELIVPLVLPIDGGSSEARRFPAAMTIEADGPIELVE